MPISYYLLLHGPVECTFRIAPIPCPHLLQDVWGLIPASLNVDNTHRNACRSGPSQSRPQRFGCEIVSSATLFHPQPPLSNTTKSNSPSRRVSTPVVAEWCRRCSGRDSKSFFPNLTYPLTHLPPRFHPCNVQLRH